MASPLKRLRIDPSDLALEIVSIVIAILLANIVGQAVEGYRAGTRTHQALARICQEIASDDVRLPAPQRLHRDVRAAFVATLDQTRDERLTPGAFSRTFQRSAPHGMHPFAGSAAAWTLAQNANEIASVPYEERSLLQARYAEVEDLDRLNAGALAVLEVAPTDDRPNFYFVASTLASVLGDVVAAEDRLQGEDARALAALHRSGDC